MKPNIQLQIPTPCHQSWNGMTETEQGRFCQMCQKEVIDFSIMSDKEILQHILKSNENICGRVQSDQLNRAIQAPRQRIQLSFKYFWSLLITSFLVSYKAIAQTKKNKQSTTVDAAFTQQPVVLVAGMVVRQGKIASVDKPKQTNWQIKGKVVNENNNPMSYASITVNGDRNKGVAANNDGEFVLSGINNIDKITLHISCVGYSTKVIEIEKLAYKKRALNNNRVEITLPDITLKQQQLLGEVVVTGFPLTSCKRIVGRMSIVKNKKKDTTLYTKIKAKLTEIVGTNEVTIYPNPVVPNTNFNIAFNIKKTGDYAVLFIDAAGKTIQHQKINVVGNTQIESFSSHGFLSAAMYVVKVVCVKTNKAYTAKLVMQ